MVENGHNEPEREVAEFGFTNPDRAPLGIEVADYGRMTSRLSPQMLASVHCTDVHQVFLITAGMPPPWLISSITFARRALGCTCPPDACSAS